MTTTQKNVDDGNWEEEFDAEWKYLLDWVGSGFRYHDVSLTAKGLDEMKPRFKSFIRKVETVAYERGRGRGRYSFFQLFLTNKFTNQ